MKKPLKITLVILGIIVSVCLIISIFCTASYLFLDNVLTQRKIHSTIEFDSIRQVIVKEFSQDNATFDFDEANFEYIFYLSIEGQESEFFKFSRNGWLAQISQKNYTVTWENKNKIRIKIEGIDYKKSEYKETLKKDKIQDVEIEYEIK